MTVGPTDCEIDILCEYARFATLAAPSPRNASVAAPWIVGGRGGGGGFAAEPVAVNEAAEAALEVQREPAGERRMGRVLPEPGGAAPRLEVGDNLSHPAIVSGDAAAGGEVEDERRGDGDVEREPSRGPFEPDQAGGIRAPACGVQREADGGARARRATPFDWSKYNGKKDVVYMPAHMSPEELLMGMEWADRQFYSLPSIVERMGRSRTGLWWNIVRKLGYHLALRNFGGIGYDPQVASRS
jgi:hypothetical protein